MAKKTKKMQRGGRSEATHMASGQPIQWQSGATGQRRKADYMSHVAPKVARKQMKRQAAAGGPGRGAMRAAGPGGKAGGAVKKMQGGGVTSVRGRGGPNVRPKVNVLGTGAAAAHQRARAGGFKGTHASELASQQGPASQRTQSTGGRRGARGGPPGFSGGGTVSYNDLIRSKGW